MPTLFAGFAMSSSASFFFRSIANAAEIESAFHRGDDTLDDSVSANL